MNKYGFAPILFDAFEYSDWIELLCTLYAIFFYYACSFQNIEICTYIEDLILIYMYIFYQNTLRKRYDKVPYQCLRFMCRAWRKRERCQRRQRRRYLCNQRVFALSSGIAGCLESAGSESFIRPVLSAMHHSRCTVVVPLSFPVHIAVNIARCAAQYRIAEA